MQNQRRNEAMITHQLGPWRITMCDCRTGNLFASPTPRQRHGKLREFRSTQIQSVAVLMRTNCAAQQELFELLPTATCYRRTLSPQDYSKTFSERNVSATVGCHDHERSELKSTQLLTETNF
jgi:hypothetical protein